MTEVPQQRVRGLGDRMTEAPEWYTQAIATEAELGEILVHGARIATRSWGVPGGEGIVLVHGGAAHARWWDHIAPLLAAHHRVVALDLSGHGDSDYRPSYRLDLWAEEVLAAADGFDRPPTIVGHSLGGMVTLRAAALAGHRLNGVIIIDTPVSQAPPEQIAARDKLAFGPKRRYPTREDAMAHFRPVPPQPILSYVEEYIALNSVRESDEGEPGWVWKFDPLVFSRPPVITDEVLTRLACWVAFFRAENGMIDPAMERIIYDGLGRVAPVIEIPKAGHHVMLDQPLALVTGIRTLLGVWEHSLPLQ